MSSELIRSVDCAYPQNWATIPDGTHVVLGYVGQDGATPHVWTLNDIESVERADLLFAPIWTPPQGHFDRNAGAAAGNATAARLRALGYPPDAPVFLDIEKHTYDAAPEAVEEGIAAWSASLTAQGPFLPVAYAPTTRGKGWVADWTGHEPTSLPDGWDGQQYAGRVDGDRYDLSVFRPEVFTHLHHFTEVSDMPLNDADKAWIKENVSDPIQSVHLALGRISIDNDPAHEHPEALKHIHDQTVKILAEIGAGGMASIDVKALATDIADAVRTSLGADVAAEIGKRLTNG